VIDVTRPAILRWLVAVGSVGVVLVARILLEPHLAPTVFLLFFAAVTVSGWYGGFGPGLLATVLSAFASYFVFMAPRGASSIGVSGDFLRVGLFVVEGVLISFLTETLHRSTRRAVSAHRAAVEARRESGEAMGMTRRASQEQEALRSRLAAVVEASNDAIVTTDLEGRITSWNPGAERMFGHSGHEAIGRSLDLFVPPDRARESKSLLDAACRGERPGPIETVRMRRDGSHVDVSIACSPLLDPEGRMMGVAGILRDISQRRRDEEEIRSLNRDLERRVSERTVELEVANQELEAFTYSVSHDLRAPLRALEGFSRIVLEDYSDRLDPEAQRYLNMIRDNTQRMARLIQDLLQLSRLSRQPLERRPVEPAGLVREALEVLAPELEGRPVEFVVGDLPHVEADRGLLKQVFVNLLSNAIKYTRKRTPAHIEIGARDDAGVTVYFVRDDGVGFDMRYATKLFGVFQRMHRAEEYEGTGVGLAIAKRIVNRHGGRIWAESAPDKGSTFSFTLGPAAAGAPGG
jgi:PAS domain S-box-containing protein